MMSRHFNDPNADAYFTKRKWGKRGARRLCFDACFGLGSNSFILKHTQIYSHHFEGPSVHF